MKLIIYHFKMPGLMKWCAHPTRYVNDTKVGKRPSHPKGHHPISAQLPGIYKPNMIVQLE